MAREHFQAMMPSGVIELCEYWFDEPCPVDDAAAVAAKAAGTDRLNTVCCLDLDCPTIGGAIVWLKSRLLERGVLRALARELNLHDDTPRACPMPATREATPEELQQMIWKMKWAAPAHLGHTRSRLSSSPLVLRAINRTADRVCHFENDTPCPYCKRRFRNGAALRLHVIDFHLHEYQE